MEEKIVKLKCNKCGWKWWPKSPEGPGRCPRCGNNWRTPYRNKSRQATASKPSKN